jgi:hypothetical protein
VSLVQSLQEYLDRLVGLFQSSVTALAENPGYIFPPVANRESGGGIRYFLPDKEVAALQTGLVRDYTGSLGQIEYQILFTIPAPTAQSTTTSGSPDHSPFVNDTNVRLDQVLVWLFRATVQPDQNTQESQLSIEMCHMGDDAISVENGKTICQFMHSTTQLKFEYDPTNVTSWAVAKTTEPLIVQNLNAGLKGVGRSSVKSARDPVIAPIGPFAT